MIKTITINERKCGRRKEWGMYLVGGDNPTEDGVLKIFTVISPPIPYQQKVHRTARIVDASAVLSKQPVNTWWFGNSKQAEEAKLGEAWANETFGMSVAKRLKTGVCSDCTSADEAVALLAERMSWDARMIRHFQLIFDLPEKVNAAATEYQNMLDIMRRSPKQTKDLLDLQACIWRMASKITPRRRKEFIPKLAAMLVVLGLFRDGIAMLELMSHE